MVLRCTDYCFSYLDTVFQQIKFHTTARTQPEQMYDIPCAMQAVSPESMQERKLPNTLL